MDFYVKRYRELGPADFAQECGRPVLIGRGIAGTLRDDELGMNGTHQMNGDPDEQPSQGLEGRVWLVTKTDFRTPNAGVTIGRSPDNDVIIPEYTISSHHCEIRAEAMRMVITDLGSTNGTEVNHQRLLPGKRTPLPGGALVLIGRYVFQFLLTRAFLDSVSEAARSGYRFARPA